MLKKSVPQILLNLLMMSESLESMNRIVSCFYVLSQKDSCKRYFLESKLLLDYIFDTTVGLYNSLIQFCKTISSPSLHGIRTVSVCLNIVVKLLQHSCFHKDIMDNLLENSFLFMLDVLSDISSINQLEAMSLRSVQQLLGLFLALSEFYPMSSKFDGKFFLIMQNLISNNVNLILSLA